jgi:predicted transglutaminase-like cysteine proteinase
MRITSEKGVQLFCLAVAALFVIAQPTAGAEKSKSNDRSLHLSVMRISEPPTQYVEFCKANPGHCNMTGDSVLVYSERLMNLMGEINRRVNSEYRFVEDWEAHGVEELWSYPSGGVADCEDYALEKRKRLVDRRLPRAALTMAIVSHKKFLSSHAVLLIETTEGTYVLDNLTNDVLLWNVAPYNYESRERPDGKWDRYDQSYWTYQ